MLLYKLNYLIINDLNSCSVKINIVKIFISSCHQISFWWSNREGYEGYEGRSTNSNLREQSCKWNQHGTIFSVYFVNFIYIIYIFRTSGVQEGIPSCTPDSKLYRITKYQVSYKYIYSSWWLTWISPKHIQVTNKIDDIYWEYCAPSWFHLQDYIEMHGQQNKKT